MTDVSTTRPTRRTAVRGASARDAGKQASASSTTPAIRAFNVEVRRVEAVGANFRRITFGGACLEDFGVQGHTLDLRIKVLIPPAGRECMDVGALMDGAGSGWYQQWLAIDAAERGAMRTYTVRESRCDQDVPELDVDFVMHFDADGNGGPASQWAAAAAPGDRVWVIGPNVHAATCSTAGAYGGIEWRPGLAQNVLLAGDETAVPAISAILESLPEDIRGHAFLEVPDGSDCQDIQTRSDVGISWLVRGGRPHGELLDAAVRQAVKVPGWVSLAAPFRVSLGADTPSGQALRAAANGAAGPEPEEIDIDTTILWETPQLLDASALDGSLNPDKPSGALPFYAWIAGEAAVVRGLRRYLVRDVGIDRKQVAFMGYWRQGKAEG
ncbi:siderophore-interacting protein [Arthrobacter sp. JZ12]|uniref:siderophore-interacting protein n=1 Tax=Arthrobacter sp. JZ12 TaxID=2654190 RepID=UPI0030911BE0|nr:siderophore-interacting protein [Arthrobacter sp. JZ12]